MKERICVIFLVGALYMAFIPNGTSQLSDTNCPPNGCRIVNSSITITPIFLNSTQDKYLQFRFYDSKNNETIPHVSFFLNVTKNGQKLMYDFFHTESGIAKLKFEPRGVIGNWTVKGEKDPFLDGWMNNTGPIVVYSPIFVENGSYHIHVEMIGAFSDKELIPSWASPKFDSYVTVRNNSGSQTVPEFPITLIILLAGVIGILLITKTKWNQTGPMD